MLLHYNFLLVTIFQLRDLPFNLFLNFIFVFNFNCTFDFNSNWWRLEDVH